MHKIGLRVAERPGQLSAPTQRNAAPHLLLLCVTWQLLNTHADHTIHLSWAAAFELDHFISPSGSTLHRKRGIAELDSATHNINGIPVFTLLNSFLPSYNTLQENPIYYVQAHSDGGGLFLFQLCSKFIFLRQIVFKK